MPAPISRRSAIQVGGAGLFAGLTMPEILAARRGPKSSAQAVIFLHQWGGPGQHETLDPKPDAPDGVRGWYGSIPTKIPGVRVGEHLPRVAQMLDKVTVIRSLAHTVPMKNHNSAGYYALTGSPPPTDDQRLRDTIDLMPAYGSLVSKLGRADRGAPPFVALPHVIADGSVTPGQHASFLGQAHNPLLLTEDPNAPDFRLPELSLPEGVTPERLADRVAVRRLIDAQAAGLENSAIGAGLGESFGRAVDLLTSPKFKAAFELNRESKATRERYGRTTYGQSCLLARRLVEAGARFVNVYYARSIGGAGNGWDYHRLPRRRPQGPAEGTAPGHGPDLADADRRPAGARAARIDDGRLGSASSAARRKSVLTAAATTGRSATARSSPAAGRRRATSTARRTSSARTRSAGRSAPKTWPRRCCTRWGLPRSRRSSTRSAGRTPRRAALRSGRFWREGGRQSPRHPAAPNGAVSVLASLW